MLYSVCISLLILWQTKSFAFAKSHDDTEQLIQITMQLNNGTNIIILGNGFYGERLWKIVKNFNQFGYQCKVISKLQKVEESFVIALDTEIDQETVKFVKQGLILLKKRKSLEEIEVKMNQEIFFYDYQNQSLWESYTVNNILISEKLTDIFSNGTFKNKIPSKFTRRKDLQGLKFKVLTVPSFWPEINTVGKSGTFAITNELDFTKDYPGILKALEYSLNFSTDIYANKDFIGGSVSFIDGKATAKDGMIKSIFLNT